MALNSKENGITRKLRRFPKTILCSSMSAALIAQHFYLFMILNILYALLLFTGFPAKKRQACQTGST